MFFRLRLIHGYLYVRIDNLESEQLFCKTKTNNSTLRRETMRTRPRPPLAESGEASKERHDEQTTQREVDLIASKFVRGSKPGRTMSSRGLTRHVDHHCVLV